MDVPLALNDIGIRNGYREKGKSSTFGHQTGGVGLCVFYTSCNLYFN